jgi:hypothetical protein
MSFTTLNNLPNFSVKMGNKVPNSLEDYITEKRSVSQIYATITFDGSEVRIDPIGLENQGQFYVSMPGPSISFTFVLNEGYSSVSGVVSVDTSKTLSMSKPSVTEFEFTIGNITSTLFATVSLAVI